MTLKDQLQTLKKNWLIALILIILVVMPLVSNPMQSSFTEPSYGIHKSGSPTAMIAESRGGYYAEADFAPNVQQRKFVASVGLDTEVKRGKFLEAQSKIRDIVRASDSFIVGEDSTTDGYGNKEYSIGYFNIKVESSKYKSVLAQLKEVGKVTTFHENLQDVTGEYTNLQIEIEAEQERLKRFKDLYSSAKTTQEKIDLTDRIFNQERRVKYLQDRLQNTDTKVEYTTISIDLREKQSSYFGIALVKLSDLVRGFVNSVNKLLTLLFVAIPYAVVALVIWLIARKVRKK